MGFGLSDIIPCEPLENYEQAVKTLAKINAGKPLTPKDKKSLKFITTMYDNIIELWDSEG